MNEESKIDFAGLQINVLKLLNDNKNVLEEDSGSI